MEPFSLVYDAIYAAVANDRPLREFIKEGNIIRWQGNRSPLKEAPSNSDLPELQIIPATVAVRLGSESCGSEIVRTHSFVLNTGNQDVSKILFPIEWRLLQVIHKLQFGGLESLRYKTQEFVTNVELISAETGLSNAVDNRMIQGWTSLWSLQVTLHIKEW